MIQSGRLAYLMARKAQVDSEVHQELTHHNPDHLRLSALKRRRLQLNDEISQLAEAS